MTLLIDTLLGNQKAKVPFWFMRQAGRYLPEYKATRSDAGSFLDLCYNPELATEVTLQPLRRFGMSAAILFSDILVIPHAMGRDLRFQTGEGPMMSPLQTEEIDQLSSNGVTAFLSPVYEAVRSIRNALDEDTPLIGFSGAPWTLACYMVDGKGVKEFPATRHMAYSAPAKFEKLISILTDAVIDHLSAQIEAGAQVVKLFDSWAGLLPEKEFYHWVITPAEIIVSTLKERYPHVPVIAFPKGAGLLYKHYAEAVGSDGIAIDMNVPIAWAAEHLSPHAVVQGNLDNRLLVADGERTVAQAEEILQSFNDLPFVFNLGHGMLPETPISNVEQLVQTIKAHNERHLTET